MSTAAALPIRCPRDDFFMDENRELEKAVVSASTVEAPDGSKARVMQSGQPISLRQVLSRANLAIICSICNKEGPFSSCLLLLETLPKVISVILSVL